MKKVPKFIFKSYSINLRSQLQLRVFSETFKTYSEIPQCFKKNEKAFVVGRDVGQRVLHRVSHSCLTSHVNDMREIVSQHEILQKLLITNITFVNNDTEFGETKRSILAQKTDETNALGNNSFSNRSFPYCGQNYLII